MYYSRVSELCTKTVKIMEKGKSKTEDEKTGELPSLYDQLKFHKGQYLSIYIFYRVIRVLKTNTQLRNTQN